MQTTNTIFSPTPTPVALQPTSSSGTALGVSFQDVLDAVNPLQHVPVASAVYRSVTGQSISTGSQLAGDALYSTVMGGGVPGLALQAGGAAINALSTALTGSDLSTHLVNTVSALTTPSNTPGQAVALVPDPPGTPLPAQTPPMQTAEKMFFPAEKNAAATAAQYHRAQLLGNLDHGLATSL